MDQALDHELDAFILTLKHNLLQIGYPIEGGVNDNDADMLDTNPFKKPL